MSVFISSLLDQGSIDTQSSNKWHTAQHLQKQEGFHICDYPSGFHFISFHFSYLTWKPIWWICSRYFEKHYLKYFFLPFSVLQLVKTYPFIYLFTHWCNTEKKHAESACEQALGKAQKKNLASQANQVGRAISRSFPPQSVLALLALDHTRLARPESQSGVCLQANGEWMISKRFKHR